jgi:uncharacterized protein HemX
MDQLLEMKKMLAETEVDVQSTQRMLDQSEAANLQQNGELASLRSENETLDACQRDLTEMVKSLENQKHDLENKLASQIEEYRQVNNRVETSEQQLEQLQEEIDSIRTKAEMADQLEKSNHELKNKTKKAEEESER